VWLLAPSFAQRGERVSGESYDKFAQHMPTPSAISITHLQRLAAIATLLAATGTTAAAATEPLKPCRVPGFRNEVQCGVLQRALDPSQPAGTQIDVHYVVVPALARRKLPDPVFLLAGGPGQSAIDVAPMVAAQWGRLNNRRDLVFVDQRGTGQSAPLMCDEDRAASLAQELDPQRRDVLMRQCLSQLQKLPYGDLRFFTTTLAMQDLDAVRQALGAPRINLVGVSYGTRATLEYLRQFPQAVRRSVIDGVAPPDMALPASVSMDSQTALNALLASCEQDAACNRSYPRLRQDWLALLASLPKHAQLTHPLTGAVERVTLTRDMLLGGVRTPLYLPVLASALPRAISEAAQGRFDALLGLGGMIEPRGRHRPAVGMHFSVVCAEDMARVASTTDVPGPDFGTEFGQFYTTTCAYWPRGTVPADFYRLGPVSTPTLVLSGGLDPVTPPRHGARVAKALGPQAQHVVVPNAGHGVSSLGCMQDVLFRFIDAADDAAAPAINASCATKIPRPPAFVPVTRREQGTP
jgi:pimeloyl-ACP methyl ester carboxylesterase